MIPPGPRAQTSTDPRGVNRATNGTTAGNDPCPDFYAVQRDLAAKTGRRVRVARIKSLYQFFLAQAEAAADFREWVITYADPTGETATNNVLWGQAKEMTA